jgi:hypothetical protein
MPANLRRASSVMATLVTKLSFVTRVAISGVWLTSHTDFCHAVALTRRHLFELDKTVSLYHDLGKR